VAPEQVRGAEIDGRADLYSLGCVLHEMLRPHLGLPAESDGSGSPRGLDPTLPEDVRAILRRAANAAPEGRYATAAEMAAASGAALAKRLEKDSRTMMREFMADLRPQDSGPQFTPNRMENLFNLELILDPAAGPVRRFGSIAARISSHPSKSSRSWEDDSLSRIAEVPSLDSGSSPETSLATPSALADPLIGTQVHGYRLVELLGKGAWARVYRGEHQVLRRECAVKVLASKGPVDEVSAKRLRREAELLSSLSHPNLVVVTDAGVTQAGLPFLMMELLRGQTLRDALKPGPFLLDRTASVARQIAEGLAEAHRHGLVHRDLKTRNVMLVDGGSAGERVKILDFGVARVTNSDRQLMTQLTAEDRLLGTPSYMAPEQIQGASGVGPSADLYSLGVILFEMIAGEVPFRGRVVEVIEGHLHQPPPPLPEAAGLEQITERLLKKEPSERFSSAEDVIRAIADLDLRATAPGTAPSGRPTDATRVTVLSDRSAFASKDEHSDPTDPGTAPRPRSAREVLAPTLLELPTDPGPRPTTQRSPVAISWAPAAGRGSKRSLPWLLALLLALVSGLAILVGVIFDRSTGTSDPSVPEAEPQAIAEPAASSTSSHNDPASPPLAAPEASGPKESPKEEPRPKEDPKPEAARAKPPPHRPAAHAPTTPSAHDKPPEERLARALQKRGLGWVDVPALEGTSEAWSRWQEAKRSGDQDALRAAAEPLLHAIESAPMSKEFVLTKLRRIADRIEKSVGRIPKEQLDKLENRYFELLKEAKSSDSPDLRSIAAQASALELELKAQ
jgi:serine/threonine protein kinase